MMMVMPKRPVKETFRLGLPCCREVRPSAWADPVEELHIVTVPIVTVFLSHFPRSPSRFGFWFLHLVESNTVDLPWLDV